MALGSSYAADCTEKNDRNVALGWFHGSMFFGMAAGPVFGGSLGMSSGKSNPLLIFYAGLVKFLLDYLVLFIDQLAGYACVWCRISCVGA